MTGKIITVKESQYKSKLLLCSLLVANCDSILQGSFEDLCKDPIQSC